MSKPAKTKETRCACGHDYTDHDDGDRCRQVDGCKRFAPKPEAASEDRWVCDDPDCGWTEDEHVAFGGGKALQCPHPKPEAASEVFPRADLTHSEVVDRLYELGGYSPQGVEVEQTDAALRAALKKAEEARDEAMKQRDPAVVMAARLIAQNADKHPAGCCYKCSEGLAQRNAAEARVKTLTKENERLRRDAK